jgi:protein-S-isoprenylcysteine O-methyltransferase Ste14
MKKPKTIPPLYFYLGIILIISINILFPNFRLIIYPYNLIGIILIIFGFYLNSLAWKLFKQNKTTTTYKKSKKLITNGIFKITRNPIYIGMSLILLGISISIKNIFAIIIPLLFFIIINKIFIPYEEWKNKKTFGKEYLKYKKKVRRWL